MKLSTFALLLLATFGFFSRPAAALDLPQQKAGMWETTIQHSSDRKGAHARQPGTSRHCIDAGALAAAKKTADDYAKKNCSKNETRRNGSKWVTDMACKMGTSTMTTHSVTEFSGENVYHTEMTTTFDPPMAGESHSSTTVDGKWVGACKPQ